MEADPVALDITARDCGGPVGDDIAGPASPDHNAARTFRAGPQSGHVTPAALTEVRYAKSADPVSAEIDRAATSGP